jgi:hypothetical protein
MNVLGRLTALATARYGRDAVTEFRDWFDNSGHACVLDAPLLRGPVASPSRLPRLDGRALAEAGQLDVANPGEGAAFIDFRLDLTGAEPGVESLFDRFVRCCSHTNALGNFREEVDYYARVYDGQRYLMAHGDGTCGSLGLSYQSLARRLLGEEIHVRYARTAHGELTHVYCTCDAGPTRPETFLDPDQKTRRPLVEMTGIYPFGFLFQLFAVAGYEVYAGLPEDVRRRLFFSMTHAGFESHRSAYHQASYQQRPGVATLSRLFAEAKAHHHELLRIEADDFPWKARMRARAAALPDIGAYFLCRTDAPFRIEIPAGGALRLGFAGLPPEMGDVALVHCNRVPAAVWFDLAAGEPRRLRLPELPWLVVAGHGETLQINGRALKPWLSRDDGTWVLGAGDLETAFNLGDAAYDVEIVSPVARRAALVMPFNAFAAASGWVECRADAGVETTIFR